MSEKKNNVDFDVKTVSSHRKHYHEASIEERMYYADLRREEMARDRQAAGLKPSAFERFIRLAEPGRQTSQAAHDVEYTKTGRSGVVTDQEKDNARRAMRTATWIGMFYLITTDVLGPFNAGYAFSTLGFVGGVLLYIVFGAIGAYSSYLLLYMYCKLDSDKHPIRNYGDMMHISLGRAMRQLSQAMQFFQLVFVVATTLLTTAQGLYQLSQAKLCFVAGIVIMWAVGATVSQIRSLKTLSWVGSISVYLNLLTIFISMGVIAHSPPNYQAASAAYGISITPPAPITSSAIVGGTLANHVNGFSNMVFAWGGLMIFPEMMAEMKRPMDFWKSIACAQMLILSVYITYGAYVYGMQGQYTLPVAFQGVSQYAWQSVGNALTLVTYTIAGALYSNISCKIAYQFLFEDLFKGPSLLSWKGRIIWTCFVIIFWIIAFIIGTSIPQVQTLQGLVGAAFLLQFSYTFPAMMVCGFNVRKDAARVEEPWTPERPDIRRVDTWRNISRWKRGFGYAKFFNTANILLALAALATSGLGIYGAALTATATFAASSATSFSCTAPV